MGTGSTQHRPDNSRHDGDPPLGPQAGFRGRRLSPPPATGSATERRSARPARRSKTPAERVIRAVPNPGTSLRGALGATGGRRSACTASGRDRKRRRGPRITAKDAVSRMVEGEFGRRPEDAREAARREVSTGTN
jgi:hypothetical protein